MMQKLAVVLFFIGVTAVSAAAMIFPASAATGTAGTVVAELSPDRALTAKRPTSDPQSAGPPGVLAKVANWVLMQQQRLNRELAAAVRELKAAGSLTAAFVLGVIGFSYGVLHAAGPGHGKAIISSYVLANEETVRRGIMLSFLSSFIQALSAIVLVGILAVALNATSLEMRAAEGWIETVSWAFVTAVGAWLLYGQIRQVLARRAHAGRGRNHTHTRSAAQSHVHTHTHAPGESCGCPPGHHHDEGGAAHAHAHDDCCGHAHIADPKDLQGELSWGKALAIALSVGIRPCTGAILVLVFALSQGLLWAGVFATFAMALGTAITVSTLAALAVGSRDLAVRLGGEGSTFASTVSTGAGLLGASLVLLMGAVFFYGSLQPQAPF